MLKHCLYLLACLLLTEAIAQSSIPQVPSKMDLADMKLTITSGGQEDIQRDVNMLRASDRYFKVKLDRVALYMPIIERIFKEENIPDDLKYLVLQESALISDAVSSSNAVGFWQFKDFTAKEVGMRVDKQIDERKNIVSSSYGAAKYFMSHQKQLDNWALTVTAHMTGAAGIKKYIKKGDRGAKKMTIDKKTHWYLKRFLAHKIAFEDHLDHKHSQGLTLVEYTKGDGKDLNRIAKEFDVSVDDLTSFNKWLLQGRIPDDRKYTVTIPVAANDKKSTERQLASQTKKEETVSDGDPGKSGLFEGLQFKSPFAVEESQIKVNGVAAIVAATGESFNDLVARSGLSMTKFLKFNDLEKERLVLPGDIYFVKKKKGKSAIGFHTVKHGEDFWQLSQQYGIRMAKLASHNRMSLLDQLKPGRVLWMAKKRPNNVDVEYREVAPPAVEEVPVAKKEETQPTERREIEREIGTPEPETMGTNPSVAQAPVAVAPILGSTPTASNQPQGDPEATTHTVQAGETLWGISKMYNVDVSTLRKLNSLDTDVSIQPGQQLTLKAADQPTGGMDITQNGQTPTPSNTPGSTHLVQPGETLWQIAKQYGMEVSTLRALNDLKKNDPIKSGQELVLKKKVSVVEKNQMTKATSTYVVQPGDTLYGIAKSHDMELKELLKLNGKDNPDLSVGEELLVYE